MCKKEKPIKLGQIKNGKLENYSLSVTWDFDYTLCIFIRDSLIEYKKVNNGYPVILKEKYGSEEDAMAEYNRIIQTIIDDLHYYLTEQDFASYDTRMHKFKEAFDLLKEWLPRFWW